MAMSITPAQCRAARGLLSITQQELARASGVSLRSINNFERGERGLMNANMLAICQTLEDAGVEFLDGDGVRIRQAAEESR